MKTEKKPSDESTKKGDEKSNYRHKTAKEGWIEEESGQSSFRDKRLERRVRKLLEQIDGAIGQSIPLACQDWANTKAAYRFLSNERVSEEEILAGHFRECSINCVRVLIVGQFVDKSIRKIDVKLRVSV